jgi:hypothetical protein
MFISSLLQLNVLHYSLKYQSFGSISMFDYIERHWHNKTAHPGCLEAYQPATNELPQPEFDATEITSMCK